MMLFLLFTLIGLPIFAVQGGILKARDGQNTTATQATTTETLTVVPVAAASTSGSASASSSAPASSSSTTFYSTYYYTSINSDGSTTTISAAIPLATTTEEITTTLSYLGTTLTYASTITYDAEYPPGVYLPDRCQYFGLNCPTPTILSGSVGTLVSEDSSISLSSYLSQCSKTINMNSVTADSSTTYTEVAYLPPTTLGGTPGVTTITTVVTKPPESKVGCCGACQLTFSNVDVLYFPPPGWGTTQCLPQGGTAPPAEPTGSTGSTTLRGSTFVNSNGYTFVSPSVYVAFTSVSGSNICGQVGKYYDNFTLGFAPGELSTEWRPFGGFKFPAVATWPWDVNSVVCGDRPIIAFPDKLRTAIDPAWEICTAVDGSEWQGNDPPICLTPQSALAIPTKSSDPINISPTPKSTPASPQPTMTSQTALGHIPGSSNTPDPDTQPSGGNNKPSQGNQNPQPSQQSPGNAGGANPSQSPSIVAVPVTTTEANGQVLTTTLFSLAPGGGVDPGQPIASHIGVTISSGSPVSAAGGSADPTTTGSEVLVIGPGTTLTMGGPTVTISGTPYVLGTNGLTMGTRVIPLPTGTSVSTGAASRNGMSWPMTKLPYLFMPMSVVYILLM